jgi:hypothetical protein
MHEYIVNKLIVIIYKYFNIFMHVAVVVKGSDFIFMAL